MQSVPNFLLAFKLVVTGDGNGTSDFPLSDMLISQQFANTGLAET